MQTLDSNPSPGRRASDFLARMGRSLTPWGVLKFVFGAVSIALALGWAKYVGAGYVYLPSFPDYLDVALGVLIGVFLFSDYFKDLFSRNKQTIV